MKLFKYFCLLSFMASCSSEQTPQELLSVDLRSGMDHPSMLALQDENRKSEEEYAEYQHALRKLNYDLKQLAVYCGIKLNVSSYTSRHTWAQDFSLMGWFCA